MNIDVIFLLLILGIFHKHIQQYQDLCQKL